MSSTRGDRTRVVEAVGWGCGVGVGVNVATGTGVGVGGGVRWRFAPEGQLP